MMQVSLAEKLRVLRAQKGLTLVEASERLGVDRHTLRRLELGGGRRPQYPTLTKIAEGYGVPVEELLEAEEPVLAGKGEASAEAGRLTGNPPQDPQRWESVLASVRRRQSEVAAKVDELVEASVHSEVDPYEVKRVLDEVEDCEITLLLALPGSQRQGRNQITINLSLVAPDQWDEFRYVSHFSEDIGKRLAAAGLVRLEERAGQKAEAVPVGIGA
jgi:transcriptional regulator with XRE-family HTH domain